MSRQIGSCEDSEIVVRPKIQRCKIFRDGNGNHLKLRLTNDEVTSVTGVLLGNPIPKPAFRSRVGSPSVYNPAKKNGYSKIIDS